MNDQGRVALDKYLSTSKGIRRGKYLHKNNTI